LPPAGAIARKPPESALTSAKELAAHGEANETMLHAETELLRRMWKVRHFGVEETFR
jgi:hypothetical protein